MTAGWLCRFALAGLLTATVALGRVEPKPLQRQGIRELALVATHALSVSEPSDLAINESGTTLWTVSDKPGHVYQLALDRKVVRTLKFVGEDLEGIALDRSDHTLWVAEENRREISHLDLDGNELSRHRLELTDEKNSGLEGICLDAKGRMFAVNEKRPGLFLELNGNLSIAVDDVAKGIYIVSDSENKLYAFRLEG